MDPASIEQWQAAAYLPNYESPSSRSHPSRVKMGHSNSLFLISLFSAKLPEGHEARFVDSIVPSRLGIPCD